MIDARHQPESQPLWQKLESTNQPDREACQQGEHTWVACFFARGHLAYWECAACGKRDRETGCLPERLASINGWIKSPPQLVARGPHPPLSAQRWLTAKGSTLIEGDPSSIHFAGLAIPGLDQAHSYTECDAHGNVLQVYAPQRERLGQYSDHYWLTRYQVVADALVQFVSHCYEESTYDTPHAGEPKLKKILAGLRQVSTSQRGEYDDAGK